LIGAFYYIRIVKLMFFDEPDVRYAIEATADVRLVLSVNGMAILALGIAPGLLMTTCVIAMQGYLP
jgi:NADH-quinone oxidoreductase subunit N